MRRAWIQLVAAALAVFACGCHPSVEGLCEDLDDACGDLPYQDCLDDGKRLETLVDQRDCSDAFTTYLDCVDDAQCNWKTQCESQRKALEGCTGPFPQ